MKRIAQFFIFVIASGGLFLFFTSKNNIAISNLAQSVTEFEKIGNKPADPNADLPPQKQLENPPKVIKALYATGWTAGGVKGLNRLIELIKKTEANAIVIDIKDYSGELSYRSGLMDVEKYGKDREIKIAKPNAMIKKLHDEGIYVIARQTIFQDPVLAKARPDLAFTSSSTGKQWKDNKGVMWLDPAGKEVWEYNLAIAKDALNRGFDEINFDYIRFASDGNLNDIKYPFWDGKTLKRYVIRDFFKFMRQSLSDAKISADLFGLTTVNYGDVGIGQNIDDAFNYFDAIAPMVYPSHYNKGFNGHQNPALYPYDVVYTSMLEANKRLNQYILKAENSTSTEKYLVKKPQLRPWLQDFDLGADYTADMVRAQIDAVYGAATGTPSGWMLWDPKNIYTAAALKSEQLTTDNN